MKNETTSKEKSNLKSDMITGTSSAVGATIGMVAGNALASEVHAAEMPEEPTSPNSPTSRANSVHASSTHGQGTVSPNPVPPVTPPEQPVTPPEQPGTPPTQPGTPHDQPGTPPTQPGTPHDQQGEPGETQGEPGEAPEVVVVDYGTVTNDDGSQMDVAVVSVDGHEAYVVDENQDDIADVLISDVNGDSNIDCNEVLNIENEGISMSALQAEAMGEPSLLVADNDYVNDANVDDYMA